MCLPRDNQVVSNHVIAVIKSLSIKDNRDKRPNGRLGIKIVQIRMSIIQFSE